MGDRGASAVRAPRRAAVVRARARAPRLSAPAWGAVGATALFIALTVWWLSAAHSVPYGDNAQHLATVLRDYDFARAGDPLRIFSFPSYYPPLTFLVGVAGMLIGGIGVAGPVIAQSLVYVPLLALGCYQAARLVYGAEAALLAVVFALGAPLIAEQFHVFMLDAPQAALVAVSIWLILASERFSRIGVALAAGLVVGLGIAAKELVPLYLWGLIAVSLARGGWRNWRGVAVFALAALLVGTPWYVHNHALLGEILTAGGAAHDVPPLAKPALFSVANAAWYFWATLNGLLFAPLFAFALVGVVSAAVALWRTRAARRADLTPELLGGLGGAWLALTVMPHHDLRYAIALIGYLAVLGTGWIVRVPGRWRTLATCLLGLAVLAATLGATFGVGPRTLRPLPGNLHAPRGEGVPPSGTVIVYANHNFLVSGPERDGRVPGLLRALRTDGVRSIAWLDQAEASNRYFDSIGVEVLVRSAGLAVLRRAGERLYLNRLRADEAVAIRRPAAPGDVAPCARLIDGSGVWLVRGSVNRSYCPSRDPRFYGEKVWS